ncbi:4a-hydroxytetrahydrobiopterin dehydratase [Sinosporangium siamense]|uniref:Putative pterin-4-alpha-carbinolamine dehydratase n=1 Tax=Sinosporangium siamense TaxID=1367973 RepID=A0A919RR85_9ACTN|nr:4a-hydroxytetrahydrobiopterin dehydratase [Sinosporangium siamense]GII97259.1 putative pterin-4-alpha-carbinolamine dehydratase [Sinosporangium siamense]
MSVPAPLADAEVDELLEALPGWERDGDAIRRTYTHTYHECLHLVMYVGAKAREIGHHPDIDIRWQRVTFSSTTHDAGDKITLKDFELARQIDVIAAAHGAKPA